MGEVKTGIAESKVVKDIERLHGELHDNAFCKFGFVVARQVELPATTRASCRSIRRRRT
jgi:hypothetical protein